MAVVAFWISSVAAPALQRRRVHKALRLLFAVRSTVGSTLDPTAECQLLRRNAKLRGQRRAAHGHLDPILDEQPHRSTTPWPAC